MNTNEVVLHKKSMKERMGSMGNNLSLIIAIIGLCVVLGIVSPFFMSFDNMMNILLASGITLIRASGATIAMITGGMDLSQNAVGAVAGVLCATISVSLGAPVWAVILLSIAVGLGFGAINGVLIAYLKINPIITTIGTMQIFRGIAYLFTGVTLQVSDKNLIFMGRGYLGGAVPVSVIIAFAIFFAAFFLLKYTRFGRQVYMVGGNETASRLSGINSSKIKFICYLISGVTAGFAGMLVSAQVGAALPQSGLGTEMNVIAAIVLGGLSLSGGKGSMVGTLLGILVLSIVANGLQVLGVNQYVQMVVTGCILILAVLIDVIRSGALKKQ
ncbi:MAG: ABC transporter permease [Christensenella sp.]